MFKIDAFFAYGELPFPFVILGYAFFAEWTLVSNERALRKRSPGIKEN